MISGSKWDSLECFGDGIVGDLERGWSRSVEREPVEGRKEGDGCLVGSVDVPMDWILDLGFSVSTCG